MRNALMMIKPKSEICEYEVYSHILNHEAIGAILLNNNEFRMKLNEFKKLNYTFYSSDFHVINGTKEADYCIYNININTKNKACDKLKQIEQLNYIPIYPLEGVLNVDIDNVFVIDK
jgi:hypothetical protein